MGKRKGGLGVRATVAKSRPRLNSRVSVPLANLSANDGSDDESTVVWEDPISAFPSEPQSSTASDASTRPSRGRVDTLDTVLDADLPSIISVNERREPIEQVRMAIKEGGSHRLSMDCDPLGDRPVPFTAMDGRLTFVPVEAEPRTTVAWTTVSAAEPHLDPFATLRDLNEISQQLAAWQRLADQVKHAQRVLEEQRAAIDSAFVEVQLATGTFVSTERRIARLDEDQLERSDRRAIESAAPLEPVERAKRGLRRGLTRLTTKDVFRWSPVRMNGRIPNAVKRLSCLIGGHMEQVVCSSRTLALHCARCGYTSPGWQLDRRSPRSTAEATSPNIEGRDRLSNFCPTRLGILAAAAQRYLEQLRLKGKAFGAEVQKLRVVTTRRVRHRLAVTAGLLGLLFIGLGRSVTRIASAIAPRR